MDSKPTGINVVLYYEASMLQPSRTVAGISALETTTLMAAAAAAAMEVAAARILVKLDG